MIDDDCPSADGADTDGIRHITSERLHSLRNVGFSAAIQAGDALTMSP